MEKDPDPDPGDPRRPDPTGSGSATLEGPLLTHKFSNGGRSKHTTRIYVCICNPVPEALYI